MRRSGFQRTRWLLAGGLFTVAGIALWHVASDTPSGSKTAVASLSRASEPGNRRPVGPSASEKIAEIRGQLDAAAPVARGQIRNDSVIDLLRRLAELDPEAAIAFTRDHPELHGDPGLAAELFAGWLDRRETEARGWLDNVPTGALRTQLVPLVVSSLASEHPEDALALAGELPGYDGDLGILAAFGPWTASDELDAQPRERAYAAVFREWAASNPTAAAARAQGLEDPLCRNLALQEVAGKWMLKDAPAAIQWARAQPVGPDRNSALQGLLGEWIRQSPHEAKAYLLSLEDSQERTHWLTMLPVD
ncbi:hypothetical protein [Luteolibacter sp. LG18]|uniref:hypothetical protein n=1 Tax=Luteolibacter sp. LG18 TaxID=2819286 RepID=UPI002B28DE58|nr:hypothetical protein llg_39890 [Luteolibacter sp. LG18]